jgi:hypothetical protein
VIHDFYAAWRSACDRAHVSGALFHDFRRTAARNYRRSGEDEGVIAATPLLPLLHVLILCLLTHALFGHLEHLHDLFVQPDSEVLEAHPR